MIAHNATATSPLELVLSKLPSAKRSGKGWTAQCPAHDDHSPSLAINEGDDARALVKCFAGCTAESIVDAMGLTMRDLMPDDGVFRRERRAQTHATGKAVSLSEITRSLEAGIQRDNGDGWRLATTYDYPGNAKVLRFEGIDADGKPEKTCRPIHLNGDGWKMGWPAKERKPLYFGDVVDPSKPVYDVEGEKAANAASGIGLNVVTSSHGSNSASKTDWSTIAACNDLIILRDNNDAGLKYAEDVAQIHHAQNPSARIRIVLLPGLPDGGDIADFIDEREGSDADELRTIVMECADAAVDWKPQGVAGDCGGGLIVRRASDIETRPVDWFWRPMLVAGGINMFIGMPDVGKGVVVTDIVARKSRGDSWPPINGQRLNSTRGSVAVLSMEDSPETTIVPRLRAAGADLDRVLIVDGVYRPSDEGTRVRDSFDISRDVQRLEALRKANPDLALVTIDPMDSYINAKVDTNIGNKARAALWPLKEWAESTGVMVLIVHHFNKSVSTNAMDKVSGARSFGALPRSVWAMGRDETGERTIIAPVKMNLVKQEEKRSRAFHIESSSAEPDMPVVTWCDEDVDISASELLGAKVSRAKDEAADWLRDMLADGPMPSREILDHATQAGLAERTLRRAKDEVGVIVEPDRGEDGRRVVGWVWKLAKPGE